MSDECDHPTYDVNDTKRIAIQNIRNQESTSTAGLPISSVALPPYECWQHQNQTAHSSGSYQGQYSLSSSFYPQTGSHTSSQIQNNSVLPANQNEPIQNIRNHESTSNAGLPMSSEALPYEYWEHQNQTAHSSGSYQGQYSAWNSGFYPQTSSQFQNTVLPANQNESTQNIRNQESTSTAGIPMSPSYEYWQHQNQMAHSSASCQGQYSAWNNGFYPQTGSRTSSQFQNSVLPANQNELIQNISHESTSTAAVPMSTVACPSYEHYEQQNSSSMQQLSKNMNHHFNRIYSNHFLMPILLSQR